MTKLLFLPISIISGRIAGLAAKRVTDTVWGVVDDGQAPRADQRSARWPKLAARLAVQGAVFAVVSGLTDHAARSWFAGVTGRWPGDDEPAEAAGEK